MNKKTKEGFTQQLSLRSVREKVAEGRMRGIPQGFTLIELLVVVLIIGILAAVALPQYRFAVEKSRAQRILPILQAVDNAQNVYYLANGKTASSFQELDISIGGATFNQTGTVATISNKQEVRLCRSCSSYGSVMGFPNTDINYYIEFYFRKDRRCQAHKRSALANQLCKFLTGKNGADGGYDYNYYIF